MEDEPTKPASELLLKIDNDEKPTEETINLKPIIKKTSSSRQGHICRTATYLGTILGASEGIILGTSDGIILGSSLGIMLG